MSYKKVPLVPCLIDGKEGYIMWITERDFVLYDKNKRAIFPFYPKVEIKG